jgi:predicted transcriptional regulator YdeE
MLSSDVQEIDQPAKHLVGFSIRASLNEIIGKKLGNKLRSELASREAEIANKVGSGVYLMQVYEYAQNGWTPDSPFTQVIAREVERVAGVPDGMTAHTIPAGRFLRFLHRGPMKNIGASYDAMHAWLAQEQRGGRCPYDFEYWKDASRLEEENTEIGIHLPLLPNGKVGE